MLNLTRDTGPNAEYLVTDSLPNAAGEHVEIIDPRGVSRTTTLDSRSRAVARIEAVGTAVEARTETDFDADGNVVEVRAPRYFDASDVRGYQKCNETWEYTARNLRETHVVADGDAAYPAGAKVTESWTYNPDRTPYVHTDFRGNQWETLWSACCANRVTARVDPTTAAVTTDYDYRGNVTHTQTLQSTDVYNQTTTRYDERHRPIARTVWLVEQQVVDPNDPPIAGGGEPCPSGKRAKPFAA